jgi:hypothetical protein
MNGDLALSIATKRNRRIRLLELNPSLKRNHAWGAVASQPNAQWQTLAAYGDNALFEICARGAV